MFFFLKPLKRCPVSPVLRERHMKPTTKSSWHLSSETTQMGRVWRKVTQGRYLWKAEWLTARMQRSDEVLRKGKVQLPKAPAVSPLLACGERKPSFENTHVYTPLTFAHPSAMGKAWKLLKCPVTEERVKTTGLI